jgi:hypothetical protein
VNKLACQYALLRFRPFVETGEFANVGVVLLCPEGRFFGYQMLKTYARVTQFFHQLDSRVYLNGRALFLEELDRFAGHLRKVALDGRKRQPDVDLATRLFAELTRPRDAMLQFDDLRLALAADPKTALKDLFDHFVDRGLVTKTYQERLLENSVRRMLFRIDPGEALHFQPGKVEAGNFVVNFPFVERSGQTITRVIKPLYLGHADSTRVLTHGGQWVDKVTRLRKRKALPESVLFPLAAPPARGPAYAAFEEIREDLMHVDVEVVAANDETRIQAFAAALA